MKISLSRAVERCANRRVVGVALAAVATFLVAYAIYTPELESASGFNFPNSADARNPEAGEASLAGTETARANPTNSDLVAQNAARLSGVETAAAASPGTFSGGARVESPTGYYAASRSYGVRNAGAGENSLAGIGGGSAYFGTRHDAAGSFAGAGSGASAGGGSLGAGGGGSAVAGGQKGGGGGLADAGQPLTTPGNVSDGPADGIPTGFPPGQTTPTTLDQKPIDPGVPAVLSTGVNIVGAMVPDRVSTVLLLASGLALLVTFRRPSFRPTA